MIVKKLGDLLGTTTSGSAAKTSVAEGTMGDIKVQHTETGALVSVLRTLKVSHGLIATDVLAALPLVDETKPV